MTEQGNIPRFIVIEGNIGSGKTSLEGKLTGEAGLNPVPGLFVYLKRAPEYLMENIRKRGRAYESNITAEYLERLEMSYIKYINALKNRSILIVEAGREDLTGDPDKYRLLKEKMLNFPCMNGLERFHLT